MTVMKPLQVICSSGACRRRQTVAADRVWFVDVKTGPGSHREAGWQCRFCGLENTTPPSHLPRNTISTLASRQQVLERASAADRERTESDRRRQASNVEPEAPTTPERARRSASRSAALATEVAAEAAPMTQQDSAADPHSPGKTDRRGADRIVGTDRPIPTWVVGAGARTVLTAALARISRHGGDVFAIASRRSGFEKIAVDLPDGDMDPHRIAKFADGMLKGLDEKGADLVVLGGNVGDRPWQVVLHMTAGAASFV